MKRCDKGKSCGSACIQKSRKCKAVLNKTVSVSLESVTSQLGVVGLYNKVKRENGRGAGAEFSKVASALREELGHHIRSEEDVKELVRRLREKGILSETVKAGSPSTVGRVKLSDEVTFLDDWSPLKSPYDFDSKLENQKLTRLGRKDYDLWSESSDRDKIGEGGFATVISNPKGEVVKRGILTENELSALEIVGKAKLGPTLIAADLNGRVSDVDKTGRKNWIELVSHYELRHGRVAMSRVEGESLSSISPNPARAVGQESASDVYWKSMASLHRLGIAHNDAHPGNLMVDVNKGSGKWVDFGLSQKSSKAALAEALGAFYDSPEFVKTKPEKHMPKGATGNDSPGNWQTSSWSVTGVGKLDTPVFKKDLPVVHTVNDNRKKVNETLKDKFGFTDDEVAAVYYHGIRSPLETYNQGVWSRISDDDAKGLIETLYKGV
jgi:hypothetical protein